MGFALRATAVNKDFDPSLITRMGRIFDTNRPDNFDDCHPKVCEARQQVTAPTPRVARLSSPASTLSEDVNGVMMARYLFPRSGLTRSLRNARISTRPIPRASSRRTGGKLPKFLMIDAACCPMAKCPAPGGRGRRLRPRVRSFRPAALPEGRGLGFTTDTVGLRSMTKL